MSKVRVSSFSLSFEGFGAGASQDLQNPLGIGGETLHEWMVSTQMFQKRMGNAGGTTGADNNIALRGMDNLGAWILGRNMFGPVRGSWPDDSWKGWWGDEPPYHTPVFVLTHHPRPSLTMKGGTTFHFVSDGIHAALARARDAAGAKDIRIGGGVATIRQYLAAGLIDEMHLAMTSVLLGAGEHLLTGFDLPALGFQQTECVTTPKAMHVFVQKRT